VIRVRYIICCLLVIILAGCQSKSDPTMPKATMFSVNVDVPDDLKVTEPFLLNGALVNNSNQSWEIQHGADMFTYDVYDMNGDLVLQDITQVIEGVEIVHTFKPKDIYSYDKTEFENNYKFNEITLYIARSYKVVAKAKFNIKHSGKNMEFEVISPPLKITLT
jgi:hypothetical protein